MFWELSYFSLLWNKNEFFCFCSHWVNSGLSLWFIFCFRISKMYSHECFHVTFVHCHYPDDLRARKVTERLWWFTLNLIENAFVTATVFHSESWFSVIIQVWEWLRGPLLFDHCLFHPCLCKYSDWTVGVNNVSCVLFSFLVYLEGRDYLSF